MLTGDAARLAQAGVVVWPAAVPMAQVVRIRQEVQALHEAKEPWIVRHASPTGYFLSWSPLVARKHYQHRRIQHSEAALRPEEVCGLCRTHLGRGWFTERMVADFKETGPDPLTRWHADQFPRQGRCLKTMLYLTDVQHANGAFAYIPGSHLVVRSLMQGLSAQQQVHTYEEIMAQLDYYTPNSPFAEGVRQHVRFADQVDETYSLTGPAGTLIYFDANGLHRGGRVSVGTRWIIRAHHRNREWADVCSSKAAFGTWLQRCWFG